MIQGYPYCLGFEGNMKIIIVTVVVLTSKISQATCLQDHSKPTPSWVDDANATLLDVFGEVAKDILTNKMIPETEASCDWHWMHLRCEPYCTCSYQPLWGDYHLGRSCRARDVFESNRSDSDNRDDDYRYESSDASSLNSYQEHISDCDLPPDTILYKGMNGVGRSFRFVWKKMNWRRRADNVKYKVCDSFFKIDGMGDPLSTDSIDENSNESGFFERPVRALRKSLHCDERYIDEVVEPSQSPDIDLV
eukprot:249059_1